MLVGERCCSALQDTTEMSTIWLCHAGNREAKSYLNTKKLRVRQPWKRSRHFTYLACLKRPSPCGCFAFPWLCSFHHHHTPVVPVWWAGRVSVPLTSCLSHHLLMLPRQCCRSQQLLPCPECDHLGHCARKHLPVLLLYCCSNERKLNLRKYSVFL